MTYLWKNFPCKVCFNFEGMWYKWIKVVAKEGYSAIWLILYVFTIIEMLLSILTHMDEMLIIRKQGVFGIKYDTTSW